MNKYTYDYIIVGQGIAGSLLAYQLIERGFKVLVIDDGWSSSSSKVAAGIINPITGKNFVLSWKYRDFVPVADKLYSDLSLKLGGKYLLHQPIIRTLDNVESENAWSAKSIDPLFDDLIAKDAILGEWSEISKHNGGFAEISAGSRVDFPLLLLDFRNYLLAKDALHDGSFDYSRLIIDESELVKYDAFSAHEIVFCEGAKGVDNPFFIDHRLSSTKGEVLIIRCPGLKAVKIYKQKFFIVPLGNDLFWVGAGYEWNTMDNSPTTEGKQEILDKLSQMVDFPSFEIVEHKAGIRPTVQTRRPIMKTSHIDNRIHMLNGLGTKGALIAPFVTLQFVQYLLSKDASMLNL
jgi:glycine oxidase